MTADRTVVQGPGAEGAPPDDTARRLFSRLSDTLFASVGSHTVLQRMAELAVPDLGDWCAIDGVRDDGTFARLAVAHPDPELVAIAHEVWNRYPPSPNDPAGLPQVVRTGVSELVEQVPEEVIVASARDAWHLEAIRRLELGGASFLMVPIRGRERVLGALTLVRTRARRPFGPPDLRLAEEFGRIAAVAVENARLFEALSAARARAEESERTVRAFVDNLPTLAWTAPPDGKVDFYNKRWYDYTGTTLEQMQGWGWKGVQAPEMLDEVESRWSRSLQSGEPFEMEHPLRGASGEFRWFLTRVVPQRDEGGKIVRWFGTNVDIDDIRAARALAEEMAEQSRDTGTRLLSLSGELETARSRLAELEAENHRLRQSRG